MAEMRGSLVPNAQGSIRVTGLEARVEKYVSQYNYLKRVLEPQLNEEKRELRELAKARAIGAGEGVDRVEFLASDGHAIVVSLPDTEKVGNLKNLMAGKGEAAASFQALALQLNVDSGTLVETKKTYTLRGEWVSWLDGVLQVMAASSKTPPDGLELKEETKIKKEAIQMLRQRGAMLPETDPRRSTVQQLLDLCIRAPEVDVR